MSIKYRSGYKYQLYETYSIKLPFDVADITDHEFISVQYNILVIQKGYAWDGPSGPTIDTRDFMRGSLVHDALYQLMREGYIDSKDYRSCADNLLYDICIEDGMSRFRASYVRMGVHDFGAKNAEKQPTQVWEAP